MLDPGQHIARSRAAGARNTIEPDRNPRRGPPVIIHLVGAAAANHRVGPQAAVKHFVGGGAGHFVVVVGHVDVGEILVGVSCRIAAHAGGYPIEHDGDPGG